MMGIAGAEYAMVCIAGEGIPGDGRVLPGMISRGADRDSLGGGLSVLVFGIAGGHSWCGALQDTCRNIIAWADILGRWQALSWWRIPGQW